MLAMISEDLSVKTIVEALTGSADTHLSLMRASACAPLHGGGASFWELSRECVLAHGATLIGYVEEDAPRAGLPGAAWIDPGVPPAVGGVRDARALPRCVINPPDKALRRRWGDTQLVVIKRDKRLRQADEAPPSPAAAAAAAQVAAAQAMQAQAQWQAAQQREQGRQQPPRRPSRSPSAAAATQQEQRW
jgi:hypothetical protein